MANGKLIIGYQILFYFIESKVEISHLTLHVNLSGQVVYFVR